MSGVLCFVSQDGPFADDYVENEASFSSQEDENATFVYRNEPELDQTANRVDRSTLQNSQNMARVTTSDVRVTGSNMAVLHVQDPLKPPNLEIGPLWMFLGRVFNSTIFSLILIGVTVTVSLVLGGVSVFVVKPPPYFDKSLDAFQIPNHESTKRQDAFNLAKKDSFKRLFKRSIDDDISDLNLQYNRDNAILYDAINVGNGVQQNADTNLIDKSNSKLFEHYKNPLDAPPVNEIHEMEQEVSDLEHGVSKSQGGVSKFQHGVSELHSRQRRSIRRRYRSSSWKLQLVYIAQGKGDPNIFTKERLETIHNVEMSIMNHEGFTRFCARNSFSFDDPALEPYNYCLPPNSLMTYFYPSKDGNKVRF